LSNHNNKTRGQWPGTYLYTLLRSSECISGNKNLTSVPTPLVSQTNHSDTHSQAVDLSCSSPPSASIETAGSESNKNAIKMSARETAILSKCTSAIVQNPHMGDYVLELLHCEKNANTYGIFDRGKRNSVTSYK
jgi:hypothetical protein